MPLVAAVVLLGCIVLTMLILRGRRGRREVDYDRSPELEEALERLREGLRRPAVTIAGGVIVALVLIAMLARNPSRWAVLLLALGVVAAGVTALLVAQRRRRERG